MAPKSKFYRSMQGLVLVKSETTPGVDSNPTPQADALYVIDCKLEEVVEMVDMKRKGGGFRSPGALAGKRYANVSITMPATSPWALPGWQSLPPPDWLPLANASGMDVEEVVGTDGYVATVVSEQGPWDMSAISGGVGRIVVVADGGAATVLSLDLADAAKYPDRRVVSAGQIAADVETAANAAGIDVIARKGRLYFKSQDDTVSGSIRVTTAHYGNRVRTQTLTIDTAAAGIFSITLTPASGYGDPFTLASYDAGGGDTTDAIAAALQADAAVTLAGLGLDGLVIPTVNTNVVTIAVLTGTPYDFTLSREVPANSAAVATLSAVTETGETQADLGFQFEEESAVVPVVAYRLRPASFVCDATCTVYKYYFPDCAESDDEARLSKATGCAFNPTINFDANAECTITFEGKGAFHKPVDTTFPDGWRFPARGDGLVGIGAVVSISDGSADPSRSDPYTKMDLNMNWSVEERTDATANINPNGIASFYLSRDGSATGSYDPEVVPVTDFDRWQNIIDTTRNSLQAIYTTPAGVVLTVNIDNMQLGSPGDASSTRLQHQQQFYLKDDSDYGDDYLVITISAIDPGL